MRACTQFRLDMLDNGYWPLLSECKRPIEKNWHKQRPTRDEVLSWDRSALLSTGMKIDGDLAVIDVDVVDSDLVAALAAALDESFPALFRDGLVRHAGGPKEAWFVRVDQPFKQWRSRLWYAGGDPDDPAVPKHQIECFSARATRQFGVDGPHARAVGQVVSAYRFTDGASPATRPRASLPVLPKAAFKLACERFDALAAAAGLRSVKLARPDGGHGASVVFDLTDSMTFESENVGYALEELEAAFFAARHQGRDLRVTSSFLGYGTNASKCLVGYSPGSRCVYVHDFETGMTHKPADRAPPDMAELFKLLVNRGIK
jgi:hypothetical protein